MNSDVDKNSQSNLKVLVLNNDKIENSVNLKIPNINMSEQFHKYLMTTDKISSMIGNIAKKQLSLINNDAIIAVTNSLTNIIQPIVEMQKKLFDTISESIIINSKLFESLSTALEEAKKNPDSILSWMSYYDKLSEFFWIMPYEIKTDELHEMLNNIDTEKEFDKSIIKYFNKNKVEALISDIRNMLKNNKEKKLFDQIINSYNNKSYALASIGLVTMIDNSLAYYLIDKGCSSRIRLFEPIINDLKLKRNNSDFSFIVMMINSNINLLYEEIEFNKLISIDTNKKSRRNPIAHGKSYSYKKIDTIMLMNTIYYLLIAQNELLRYKNSLYRNSKTKEFYIPTRNEKKIIKDKIKIKIEAKKININ